jgi:hypothetical protein
MLKRAVLRCGLSHDLMKMSLNVSTRQFTTARVSLSPYDLQGNVATGMKRDDGTDGNNGRNGNRNPATNEHEAARILNLESSLPGSIHS